MVDFYQSVVSGITKTRPGFLISNTAQYMMWYHIVPNYTGRFNAYIIEYIT